MTLIISILTNEAVFCSTDSLLSYSDGSVASSDAVKSMAIEIDDGKYLLSFAGMAKIDDQDTMEWMLDKFTGFRAQEKKTDVVIQFVKEELEIAMTRTTYPQEFRQLVIVLRGWKYLDGVRVNQSFILKNYNSSSPLPFDFFTLNDLERTKELITEGYVLATQGKLYAKHFIILSKLLQGQTSRSKAYKIRSKLAQLITIASRNMRGQIISDKVMGSILFHNQDGIDFAYYPEQPNYNMPHFVGKTISILGLTVKGDFVKGGTTQIGYDDKKTLMPRTIK